MKVKFKKLDSRAVIPSYAKPGDAGLDMTAIDKKYVQTEGTQFYEYDLGLSVEIPEGYVGLLFPRSSISRTNLALSNAVGVLDSGFRGRLTARFRIAGDGQSYKVGDRIVQLVILPYPKIEPEEVQELTETERGFGGYGSTGK